MRIDAVLFDHLHSCEPILLNVTTKAKFSYNNDMLRHFRVLGGFEDLSLFSETRRSLSARLDDPLTWDRSVLVGRELQTAPCQLIEIDNGEPRLGGGSPRQGLHPVERCPGAPEPVAQALAPAADARSSFTCDSGSGLLSHPRTAHRSVTSTRERLRFLPEVPDDSIRN